MLWANDTDNHEQPNVARLLFQCSMIPISLPYCVLKALYNLDSSKISWIIKPVATRRSAESLVLQRKYSRSLPSPLNPK